MVALPVTCALANLTITKCETNTFGGTDVECSYADVPLTPFSFSTYDVDRQGFDGLLWRIQSTALGQITAALRLAR